MTQKETTMLIFMAITLAGCALGDMAGMYLTAGVIILFGLAGFCLLAMSMKEEP